jgi:hypothetical protein
MKRLILMGLAAMTICLFVPKLAHAQYNGGYGDDYWYDEYWQDDPYYHHYDHYWVYYPHGYYCVYYVWYHPWWWDWYWYRCHWCHEWDWYFFGAGYYIVWYEGSHCYWRPRYGRYVRYELHYSYNDFKYKAHQYGVNLPDKPPRQIDVPYNEKEVMRLTKEKDPELYKRLEKEQKSGNLEKMRKDYEVKQRKEIEVKNEEYRLSKSKVNLEEKSFADQPRDRVIDKETSTTKNLETREYNNDSDNEKSFDDKAKKPNVEKNDWSEYYKDEDQNRNDQGGQDQEKYDKPDNRKPDRGDSYDNQDDNNDKSTDRQKDNDNSKARNSNRSSIRDKGGNGNSGGNTDGSSQDRNIRSIPGSRR